jgi:glucose-1-phosphate cytidylyltransferase
MKIVILAGGFGTRISEETELKPKPMVLIGENPVIWHLMNSFAKQGFTEFIIATGYKGEVIHDWVDNLDTKWNIKAIDTGLLTQTGGRIKKVYDTLGSERILVTYGDGLANVNINALIDFHKSAGKLATVTAVRPPARFGVLESENGLVTSFGEKRQSDAGWINGGYFILEKGITDHIHFDEEPFEVGALPRLVKIKELMSFHHHGFWQPMDTLREKNILEEFVLTDKYPWLELNDSKN